MADPLPLAPHLALTALRNRRGWRKLELARAADVSTTIVSYYESGHRPLSLPTLLRLARAMGYSPADVDAVLFGLEALVGPAEERPETEGLPPDTVLQERRAAIGQAREIEKGRLSEARQALEERCRSEADREAHALAALPAKGRPAALDARPALHAWAGVERLAHESVNAAVNDPWQALPWAELAVRAAERVADPRKRRRLLGYAWAYVANARRVVSDLRGADLGFVEAWRHWKAGKKAGWCPVEEWRLFDLEASLRRDERLCPKAMALHRKVLRTVPDQHRGRALLNVAKTHETDGRLDLAISCLREAEPLVEVRRNPHLRFAFCLNLAGYLALSGQPGEALKSMPEARCIALQLRNEVDLTRTLWVQSWIDLSLGNRREALLALDQVRRDFCARRIAYDAALATLEQGALLLEEGIYSRVRDLAGEIYWVFASRQLCAEALASLNLFVEAVKRNEATALLARRVRAEIVETQRFTEPQV